MVFLWAFQHRFSVVVVITFIRIVKASLFFRVVLLWRRTTFPHGSVVFLWFSVAILFIRIVKAFMWRRTFFPRGSMVFLWAFKHRITDFWFSVVVVIFIIFTRITEIHTLVSWRVCSFAEDASTFHFRSFIVVYSRISRRGWDTIFWYNIIVSKTK